MAFTAAVLTASDKGARGARVDESGPLAQAILEAGGYEVVAYKILPDERAELADFMREMCTKGVNLIVTTGGTGFAPRDCTPEATLDVVERRTAGIVEAMRQNSMKITPRAMLSRAEAGICADSLIVNLPGSPKAVKENLEFILPNLLHGIEILAKKSNECARK